MKNIPIRVVAKTWVHLNSVAKVTQAYNKQRRQDGKSPVKRATVLRYCGKGDGYEAGAPQHFEQFVLTHAFR